MDKTILITQFNYKIKQTIKLRDNMFYVWQRFTVC